MFPRQFYWPRNRRQLAHARIERDVQEVMREIEGTDYRDLAVPLLRIIDEVHVLRAMGPAPLPDNRKNRA